MRRFRAEAGADANLQHPGQVRVWQASDGRLVATLPTEDALVDDVTFSPAGTTLLATSRRTRQLWRAPTFGEILRPAWRTRCPLSRAPAHGPVHFRISAGTGMS